MASLTQSELRTLIIQRADLSLTDQFITNAELNSVINRSLSKLWDLALENDGQIFIPFTEVQYSAPTTAPNTYALTGAYKVIGVELWADPSGAMRQAILPAMPMELAGLMSMNASANTVFGGKYRLSGGFGLTSTAALSLQIFPIPGPSQIVSVRFLPPAPILIDDSTPVTFPNGWEEYLVLEGAIYCIGKEEGDTRELERRRDEMALSIRTASSSLDRGQPERVQDLAAYNGDGGGYGWGGWGGW